MRNLLTTVQRGISLMGKAEDSARHDIQEDHEFLLSETSVIIIENHEISSTDLDAA